MKKGAAVAATPTAPPPLTILTSSPFVGGGGDFIISPYGDQSRVQTYQGQPVLTYWQGTGLGGLASGNGLSADGHEFLITPQNTALILSYTTATANLTSIGGPADQTVINGVVQEINIATGQVLFQWNSTWPHDPEALGNNTYTFFDSDSTGTPSLPYSRAVTVKLNPWTRVATLVASKPRVQRAVRSLGNPRF